MSMWTDPFAHNYSSSFIPFFVFSMTMTPTLERPWGKVLVVVIEATGQGRPHSASTFESFPMVTNYTASFLVSIRRMLRSSSLTTKPTLLRAISKDPMHPVANSRSKARAQSRMRARPTSSIFKSQFRFRTSRFSSNHKIKTST